MMITAQKQLFGESLVQKGLITAEQLRQAQLEAKASAYPLRTISGCCRTANINCNSHNL